MSKLANGTKIGRLIRSIYDGAMLQGDVNILDKWTEKWRMQFNKYSILNVGKSNPFSDHGVLINYSYTATN